MSRTSNPIYRFKLPIGNWCGDGHEQCDYYIIESNKNIEDVREAHFNILPKTGIDIESICSNAEEDQINNELMAELKALGFVPSNQFGNETILSADDMAEIWILLLMRADPDLDLTIIPEEEMDILPFHGYDKKGRHIRTVGYGIVSPASQ